VSFHSRQTGNEGIHTPFNWVWASSAARAALAASTLAATDLNKLGFEQETSRIYVLTSLDPTWTQPLYDFGGGVPLLMTIRSASTNQAISTTDGVVVFTETANASLPAATGTGVTLRIANEGAGSRTVSVVLNGSDTLKGDNTTFPLYAGEDIMITDYAVGKWV
jgi:hypothetical protein